MNDELFLLCNYTQSSSGRNQELQWDEHHGEVQRSLVLLAQSPPVRLCIHADWRPLTAPTL